MISRYELKERAKRSKNALGVGLLAAVGGIILGQSALTSYEDAATLRQAAADVRDHGTTEDAGSFASTFVPEDVSRAIEAASYEDLANQERTAAVGASLLSISMLVASGVIIDTRMRRAGHQIVDEVALGSHWPGDRGDIVDQ